MTHLINSCRPLLFLVDSTEILYFAWTRIAAHRRQPMHTCQHVLWHESSKPRKPCLLLGWIPPSRFWGQDNKGTVGCRRQLKISMAWRSLAGIYGRSLSIHMSDDSSRTKLRFTESRAPSALCHEGGRTSSGS